MLIGIKDGGQDLIDNDTGQLKQAADGKGIENALLTNWKEYVLLNFKLDIGKLTDGDIWRKYIVFWFDIYDKKSRNRTNLKYFKYLEKESLFESGITDFFANIAQYRIWKFEEGLSEKSWSAYFSTLSNYYEFISEKYKNYKGVYGRMSEDDFEEFISTRKRNGTQSSIKTIGNNHTHVFDMLCLMKKKGKIAHFNFEENRNNILENFQRTENKKVPTRLTRQDITRAVDMYSSKRNAERNIVVYLLCSTLGMERSEILDLKWEYFSKDFKYINIHDRKIELHNMLKKYLRLYQQKQGQKKGYVFVALYNGTYKRVNESTINDIFNEFKKVDESGEIYAPQYLRQCLIISMFYDGYSLEDIIYITGVDMKNLSKYITYDMIIDRGKGHVNWKKLYDGDLCE